MVIVSPSIKKSIDTIKEFVGNHSDNDIYNALKDSNMNLDDAVHKLLHQDTFHEVRKRRDKKKEVIQENSDNTGEVETRKHNDYTSQGPKLNSNFNGHRRGGYTRRGISREFRVVRDNRVNPSSARETQSSTPVTLSSTSQRVHNVPEKSVYVASNNQRQTGGRSVQNLNGRPDLWSKGVLDVDNTRKEHCEENTPPASAPASQLSMAKQNEPQLQSGNSASSNAVGVYASASDPVHVPSPDSRSSAVGAIRREIGVVGGRRQSSDSGPKQRVSNANAVLGTSSATQSSKHTNNVSRSDQNHVITVASVTNNSTGSRFSNHTGNRFHQHPAGQKGVLSKAWKPKTNRKQSVSNPGVIGSPVKLTSNQTDTTKNVESETDELQDKLTQINIQDTQKVIIAQHIRVPDFDRCRLTFGSIGMDSDGIENSSSALEVTDVVVEADKLEAVEASPSSNQINAFDDQVQISTSGSPSCESSEDPLPDKNDSDGIPIENYADLSLVHNSSSFTTTKPEQLQESIELPNFSAYGPQPVYDMPYFTPSVDDAIRGAGLPSNQEALTSHTANIAPNSSMAMMQQQAPIAQMYPQVHLSHYGNVMPYRQYMPPMYVPPMVPGYSGNPGYPHLSNGSNYVIMPGGGSHVPANGLKYGMQQYKPYPAGSPTGFGGGLVSPNGYAMNAPGVVGGPTGLDDSSRLKYKDSNLYVPNPQAEASDVWIQNPREHPGMQSTPYLNMQQGQTPHPAYMQPLGTHPSFAQVAPQSSQMQFPGMYPPQPSGIPHLGPGNIGVGVAPQPTPGPQVGAYQQPQMNHLNWTTNF